MGANGESHVCRFDQVLEAQGKRMKAVLPLGTKKNICWKRFTMSIPACPWEWLRQLFPCGLPVARPPKLPEAAAAAVPTTGHQPAKGQLYPPRGQLGPHPVRFGDSPRRTSKQAYANGLPITQLIVSRFLRRTSIKQQLRWLRRYLPLFSPSLSKAGDWPRS